MFRRCSAGYRARIRKILSNMNLQAVERRHWWVLRGGLQKTDHRLFFTDPQLRGPRPELVTTCSYPPIYGGDRTVSPPS